MWVKLGGFPQSLKRRSVTVALIFLMFLAGFLKVFLFSNSQFDPIPKTRRDLDFLQNIGIPVETFRFTGESRLKYGVSVKSSLNHRDSLVLIRKLVMFSVREMNSGLKDTPCAKLWVNPLSVTEFSATLVRHRHLERTLYNLTFNVQPGDIRWEASVLAVSYLNPGGYPRTRLSFEEGLRLDDMPSKYGHGQVSITNRRMCVRPEEKRGAEKVTAGVRLTWAETDPELPTWPPNVSMFVSDYLEFYKSELFLKSPKNSNFCHSSVKLLIFISSAPNHFVQRARIRNTFGNGTFLKKNSAKLLFLFGKVTSKKLQGKIDKEFVQENDLVQGNFKDSYHNLSLSHLSMYNWVVTQCRHERSPMPRWMLKADDDFFLNIPLARRITEVNPDQEMIGVLFCGTKPVRDVAYMGKYYVPRYMYGSDYYVGYLSGVAYLVRTDVLERILKASLTTPLIHMDDAYVTGILAKEVGIQPKNSPVITYSDAKNPCDIVNMMSSYETDHTTLEYMWDQFQNLDESQCPLDESKLKVNPLQKFEYESCYFTI